MCTAAALASMLCSTEEKLACSLTRLLDDNLYRLNPDDEGWVNFNDLHYMCQPRPAPGFLFRIAAHSRLHEERRFDVLTRRHQELQCNVEQKPGGYFIRAHRVDDSKALLMFLRAAHNWLSAQSLVPETAGLQHFSSYWRNYTNCKTAFSEDIEREMCLKYIGTLVESLEKSLPRLHEGAVLPKDDHWTNWHLSDFLKAWALAEYQTSWILTWSQVKELFERGRHHSQVNCV